MGEIKVSLAREVAEEEAAAIQSPATSPPTPAPAPASIAVAAPKPAPATPSAQTATNTDKPVFRDSLKFVLKPNQAAEIKAMMRKGQRLTYRWSSDKGKTNYNIHGDSKALSIRYHNYEKGSVPGKDGSITAAFDGSHGWFWRNRHSETQTIRLEVNGDYQKLVRVE